MEREILRLGWSVGRETRVVAARDFRGFCRDCGGGRVFLVADARVMSLHSQAIFRGVGDRLLGAFVMESSERLKTPRTLHAIWSEMHRVGLSRSDVVLAAGGGIVLDVGAFAASTWARGTRLVLAPTTLLAQVDACLGGKTAINVAGTRNQAGTFYPAELAWICAEILTTLPEREYRCGCGEILKAAILSGEPELREIAGGLPLPGRERTEWSRRAAAACLSFKARIVEADPEEHAGRILLNLGHTLGHALESATGFGLNHGEAVALGILASAAMARRLGAPADFCEEILSCLCGLGLPVRLPRRVTGIGRFLRRDKKALSEGTRWILPFGWGDCRPTLLPRDLEGELLAGALEELA